MSRAEEQVAQDFRNLRRRKGEAAVKLHRPKATTGLGVPDADLDDFTKQPIAALIRKFTRGTIGAATKLVPERQ